MSLVTDADPPAGFGDNGMAYNRSTDGGRTWEPAPAADRGHRPALSQRQEQHDRRSRTTPTTCTPSGTGSRTPTPTPSSARPRTASGWGSRARSTSPARPTAATPGSRRARSGSRAPTSRRSATRSPSCPRAGAETCSTSSPSSSTPPIAPITSRAGCRSSARPTRAPRWGKEERVDIEFPGSILVGRNGDSTIDVEPVPAPTRPRTAAARSAPVTSSPTSPWIRATATSMPSGWTSASTAGSSSRTTTTSPSRCRRTAGAPGRRTIKVNQTPTDRAQLRPAGVHPVGRRGGRRDGRPSATTTSATTPPSPATLDTDYFAVHCHAELRQPGELGRKRDAHHADLVRHPQGAVRARLLPRRLHGPRLGRERLPFPCSGRRSPRTTPTST